MSGAYGEETRDHPPVTRNTRLGYVPALDGIRGLAILLVLADHFLRLPGGFYGVDLFFVLSGFLITTLLLEERANTGRVALRAFYLRRARRLLPALVTVLVFTCLLAAFAFATGSYWSGRKLAEGAAVCLLYSANVFRMLGHTLPLNLTPMWSLAEEEQFYFIWPALFIVLSTRLRPARLGLLLGTLAVAMTAWTVGLTLHGGATGRVYFGPDTRSTGLLIGSTFAAVRASGLRLPRIPLAAPIALAGIVALAALVHIGTTFAYAAGFPLVELSGVALIVAALAHSRLLAFRPLVWVGTISYGVYVWMATAAIVALHGSIPLILALVLGWMSTRWIEQRFRRRSRTAGTDAHPQAKPHAKRALEHPQPAFEQAAS